MLRLTPKKRLKRRESAKSKKKFGIKTSTTFVSVNVQNVAEQKAEEVEEGQTTNDDRPATRVHPLRVIEVRQKETLEVLQIDGGEDALLLNSSILMSPVVEDPARLPDVHRLCQDLHQ